MKRLLFAAALTVATAAALAADVDVSVSIGQPGFYGQIDIGGYPPPQVIYREPRMIHRVPAARQPVYLHVPPGHSKNWRKHCHRYNACNERVYFVKNNWYEREYSPRYQERAGHRRGDRDDHRGNDRNDYRGDGRNDYRGDGRNNHQEERNHDRNR